MMGRVMQLWRRYRALEHRARILVVEAAILVGIIQAGLRVLPFAWLRGMLGVAKRLRSQAPCPQTRLAWAVQAAGRLRPGRTCLHEALAAEVMLCRRGYHPTLRFGVKKGGDPAVALEAHAWVECDGASVAGRLDTLDEYTLLPHHGGSS